MKRLLPFYALAVAIAFVSCDDSDDGAGVPDVPQLEVISFNGMLTGPESEFVGQKDSLPDGSYYYPDTFRDPSGMCEFTHYASSFGTDFGGGFTYTNKTDTVTGDYTNPSAITGRGVSGDTYLVCNADTYRGNTFVSRVAEIRFAQDVTVQSACFTNATYAYRAMRDGGINEPFGADDWFKVTVRGWRDGVKTDSVDVYLAHDGLLVNAWEEHSLTALGTVDMVDFFFDSTDVGAYGMNNPAYFCMDALTLRLD